MYADIRRMTSGEIENLPRSANSDKSEPQARGDEAVSDIRQPVPGSRRVAVDGIFYNPVRSTPP
jgi:hypothetical protein